MTAPINTYNSSTELNLGRVPQVNEADNPDLYRELLDIHDALEAILQSSDDNNVVVDDFVTKFRNVITIAAGASPYSIQANTDGMIRVDATLGDIIVIAPPVLEFLGYEYKIKRIDFAFLNKVTLIGDGSELIDNRASGINISIKSSYTIKANTTGWDII